MLLSTAMFVGGIIGFILDNTVPGKQQLHQIHRESHMSAHVLLNLVNELGKRDKMRGLPRVINLIKYEHEC